MSTDDGTISIDRILNRVEQGRWFEIEVKWDHHPDVTAKVTEVPNRYDRDDGYDDDIETFINLFVPEQAYPWDSFAADLTTRIEHYNEGKEPGPPTLNYTTRNVLGDLDHHTNLITRFSRSDDPREENEGKQDQ